MKASGSDDATHRAASTVFTNTAHRQPQQGHCADTQGHTQSVYQHGREFRKSTEKHQRRYRVGAKTEQHRKRLAHDGTMRYHPPLSCLDKTRCASYWQRLSCILLDPLTYWPKEEFRYARPLPIANGNAIY